MIHPHEIGKKFQIGPNSKGLLRILEVTSVTSLGVTFKVTPHTFYSKQTEMFANVKDKDFWNHVKPYKEKIVYKVDVVWYYIDYYTVRQIYHTMKKVGEPLLGDLCVELSRQTVEYSEER